MVDILQLFFLPRYCLYDGMEYWWRSGPKNACVMHEYLIYDVFINLSLAIYAKYQIKNYRLL